MKRTHDTSGAVLPSAPAPFFQRGRLFPEVSAVSPALLPSPLQVIRRTGMKKRNGLTFPLQSRTFPKSRISGISRPGLWKNRFFRTRKATAVPASAGTANAGSVIRSAISLYCCHGEKCDPFLSGSGPSLEKRRPASLSYGDLFRHRMPGRRRCRRAPRIYVQKALSFHAPARHSGQ